MELFRRNGVEETNCLTYRLVNTRTKRVFKALHYDFVNLLGTYVGSYLKVGGKQNYCVEIKYYKNSVFGELQWVNKISGDCELSNLDETLDRKEVHIIETANVALSFLYLITHKEIKLRFSDNSTIPCFKAKDTPLNWYSFFVHGKTWYEKHFDAIPIDSPANSQSKITLDLPIVRKETDYKYFMLNPHGELIWKLYNESNTYRDFFEKLKENRGDVRLCELYLHWIVHFSGLHFSMGLSEIWLLNVNREIEPIEYTIMQTGRGKKSKKIHVISSFDLFKNVRKMYKQTNKRVVK